MRKSKAPSSGSSSIKKSSFVIPWAKDHHQEEDENIPPTSKTRTDKDLLTCSNQLSSSLSTAIDSIRTSRSNNLPSINNPSDSKPTPPSHTPTNCRSPHESLVSRLNDVLPTAGRGSDSDSTDCSYYKVMWCKLSKKKHKTWEGDAVLIAKGRNVVLKDMESKEIGRSTGYKPSELRSLVEGSSLYIGSKEIEVMSQISEEEWSSGRCFTEGSSPASSVSIQCSSSRAVKRGFVDPSNTTSGVCSKKIKSSYSVNPLHNPNSVDAFVLPKPNSQHQLVHNHHGLPCIDVVVDPRLSKHLRPHQREGVLFLYECVMNMRDYSGQGAILGDEMGLGKSLQCITLIWTLLKQGPYGGKPVLRRVVIITPGSLVKNWLKEFQKWLGTERLNVFAASTDKRPEKTSS